MPEYLVQVPHPEPEKPSRVSEAEPVRTTAVSRTKRGLMVTVGLSHQ